MLFIAAMMRISASVKARQVSAVMRNMANFSNLRHSLRSLPEAERDSTVPGWDNSGKWRAKGLRNLPSA